MKRFHVYSLADGTFTGRSFTVHDVHREREFITANTPAGHAVFEGEVDHRSYRVDLASGNLVDWQPPQPSPDHEWDAASRRWHLRPDVAERQAARAAALARIAELERAQARPMRELALDPANAEARKRLEAIEAQIAAQRGQLGNGGK